VQLLGAVVGVVPDAVVWFGFLWVLVERLRR
jgi:hypothetical protein